VCLLLSRSSNGEDSLTSSAVEKDFASGNVSFVVPVCVRKRSNTMQLQFAGMDFTCVLDSLEKYQIPEKDCLLPLLSKSLGYAIVCGSVFLKVPQVCLRLSVCLCLCLRADSNKLASVLYLRGKYRGLQI
jgi:hypothetical protein